MLELNVGGEYYDDDSDGFDYSKIIEEYTFDEFIEEVIEELRNINSEENRNILFTTFINRLL
jgi:hypothetical protein